MHCVEMLSEFSSGHICACYQDLEHFNLDGANLQMQTHLVPKLIVGMTRPFEQGIVLHYSVTIVIP